MAAKAGKLKADRYHYEVFVEALEGFLKERGSPKSQRLLSKLKFLVLGTAWVDHEMWADDVHKEVAFSYAWEDTVIAFSGLGESTLTGVVIDIWMSLPEEEWEDFKIALNKGKVAADDSTSNKVRRRYLLQYRRKSVRTPEDGFDLPSVVPTSGPSFREWAEEVELDPRAAEDQMLAMEEAERLGLMDFSEREHITSTGDEYLLDEDTDGGDPPDENVLPFPRGVR